MSQVIIVVHNWINKTTKPWLVCKSPDKPADDNFFLPSSRTANEETLASESLFLMPYCTQQPTNVIKSANAMRRRMTRAARWTDDRLCIRMEWNTGCTALSQTRLQISYIMTFHYRPTTWYYRRPAGHHADSAHSRLLEVAMAPTTTITVEPCVLRDHQPARCRFWRNNWQYWEKQETSSQGQKSRSHVTKI